MNREVTAMEVDEQKKTDEKKETARKKETDEKKETDAQPAKRRRQQECV